MSMVKGQPFVRHSGAGPFSIEGKSFVPKILTFKKTVTGAVNEDFWTAPPGAFILQAFVRIETALDGSGTAELGTDANSDALIDTVDYDEAAADAYATNIGSANADNPEGLYLPDGDVIRLTIGGTPTVGEIEGFIAYIELDSIQEEKDFHFVM